MGRGAGGRHADPDASFARSIVAGALRSLAVVLLVVAATAALSLIGRRGDGGRGIMLLPEQGGRAGPAVVAPPSPTTDASITPPATPFAPSPVPSPVPTPAPSPSSTPAPRADATSAAPDPAETTVQVLDGGAGRPRTQAVTRLLEERGYRVVAVTTARCCYDATTVFYTPGWRDAAEALRAADRRFVVVAASLETLTETVDLHVVVGADWADGAPDP